ncbi:MAG: beta-glucoside-specific PTS transporter subunit IIABC [Leuconostoc gelidum]|jgi:PTS system beta-glucosides-specific IIC component|uniref:beta-glucoside-specific PTS transporter subunit IIABC n=1 Tax=Leuconostoc gelidum TaxID=1244 RepID=UPI0002193746|nr:beta-glucoside-specific PTS transporter subunit IIABC [Leuconostoc gelidum]MBZ5979401.1 beta-glucoside-specific PTS transporter subunit IIABC [Leuconostoc gelidum subsp. gelidum]MBZ5991660.1 beta-glucoside-specific PTS transporter subunit IIABC [Leuconostoc gelidum subsp. gelidum]MBZ6002285.1 beta-glucoside-specific PTS transporter subunit IIABC [Leuconostoc gelidum subsp. gelidum]QDJ30615.1 PTS beta-glucoside transporter subunit IIABC [Leuconostoc gelidum subsp. gelidum]GMA67172.1 PTS beta
MDYKVLAENILNDVGGKDNIDTAWHCATRLRFKLKNEKLADTQKIENLDGVVTVVKSAGQYQVVIGNAVAKVFDPLAEMADLENVDSQNDDKTTETKDNVLNRFIGFISSVFTPFLGAMAGAGILKGLLALFVALGWLTTKSGAYQIWYAAGDGFFYFLPILLAFTAAKKLKVNQFVAVALATTLVYPTLVAITASSQTINFFNIPVIPTTYTSSVIPILLAVWVMSAIEPLLDKIFPESIRNIFTPLFLLIIMAPLTLIVVGPLGASIGAILSSGVSAIYNFAPALAGALLGAFWEVFVIFGVHWTFVPVMMNNISRLGYDPLLPILSVAVISQAGAALGVFLKSKDTKMKSLAGSSVATALLGITEPTIYGVTLKLKRPFILASIAGAIGGAIAGGGQAHASSFTLPSLLALPTYLGSGFISVIIGLVVAFVLGTVLTYLFGFSKVGNDHTTIVAPVQKDGVQQLITPVTGTIIPLKNVKDEVFASEAMGQGVAIVPNDNTIKSPVAGTISAVYPTGHAIGIISQYGAEVLIHIGIDTVELNGQFFKTLVQQNQKVSVGESLVEFDREAISEAGFDTTVMLIITNTPNYNVVVTENTLAGTDEQILTLTSRQEDSTPVYKGEVQHV